MILKDEAGLKLEQLWHNIDDPNEIFLLLAVEDLAKARAFVTSSDVPEAQQK